MSTPIRVEISTDRVRNGGNPIQTVAQIAIPIALVVIVIWFSLSADTFLSFDNAQNIMRQSAVLLIAAVGLTVVLICGGIDISQGAVMAASGLVAINAANAGVPDLLCIVFALLTGAAIGAVNGFFAEWIRVPALMATLGVGLVIRGLVFVSTEGRSVSADAGRADLLDWIGRSEILGVPTPFAIAGLLALVAGIALRYTVWGKHGYAIGGNPRAARAVGINVHRYRWLAYIFGATTSALAGIVLAGRLGSASPSAASTIEFDVITAVVLGGVSIFGGVGKMWRVVIAALFLATLANGLIQLNVPAFWSGVVTGGVFLAALSLDRLGRGRRDDDL
jgi:ribose transport system permease protein